MMKSQKSAQSQQAKSRKTSKPAVFRLTRQRQEHINTLADNLAKIAPTTVYWDGSFSIETLAKEWRLSNYFDRQRNKENNYRYQLQINYFIQEILIWSIQIKIIQAWILKREFTIRLLRNNIVNFANCLVTNIISNDYLGEMHNILGWEMV